MEQLADRVSAAYRSEPGFQHVTFLADDASGEYGYISFWDTKEEAEAAGAKMNPQLQEAVRDMLKGQPTIRLFEVHEANG